MPPADEVEQLLRDDFGFAPDRSWLEACLAHLEATMQPVASMAPHARLQLVLEQLLSADLHAAGAGGMLPDVAAMHKQPLEGRFLLQVDEAVNISAAWRDRWGRPGSGGGHVRKSCRACRAGTGHRLARLERGNTCAASPAD